MRPPSKHFVLRHEVWQTDEDGPHLDLVSLATEGNKVECRAGFAE